MSTARTKGRRKQESSTLRMIHCRSACLRRVRRGRRIFRRRREITGRLRPGGWCRSRVRRYTRMSTLLSRIFGRKNSKPVEPENDDRIDVSALKPLMSPKEFAEVKVGRTASVTAPVRTDPSELSGAWTMDHVLKTFPSAQRALFQRFHIGGCNSCGYMPHDTLEKVSRDHGLETDTVVAFIKESSALEKDLEITPAETAQLLKQETIKLVDVRTPQEYQIAHVEGNILADQAMAQEIINT